MRAFATTHPGPSPGPHTPRVWRLRSHLAAMLMASTLLTFSVVLGTIVLWRLPLIEQENAQQLRRQVEELSTRLELLLGARQSRMQFLSRLAQDGKTDAQVNAVLDSGVGAGDAFQAFYRVTRRGIVNAVGLPMAQRSRRGNLIGSDISALPLWRAAMQDGEGGTVWSGHYLSPLTGSVAIGMAYRDPDGQHVLIGEISRNYLLAIVHAAASVDSERIWVVDGDGEILADIDDQRAARERNIRNWPLMRPLLRGETPPTEFRQDGKTWLATTAHSRTLGWYFIGSTPKGLDHARAQVLLTYAAGTLAGGLVVGLVVALVGALRMARPLQEIVRRAAQTTSGQATGEAWPHGSVAEFNALADDLARMAQALQQREHKLSAIFNATPIPMVVHDARREHRIIDVNEAWCHELGRQRKDVIDRTALGIGLWRSPEERAALLQTEDGRVVLGEATLVRGDRHPMLFQCFGRRLLLEDEELMVWGSVHIGPLREVEAQLRELNVALEARIARRTQSLKESNEELHATVERLQRAQTELVRSEKMAALGALVAGVAHELNTPLGNGVLAVSTLQDTARQFQSTLVEAGLRRADLQQFIDQVAQGTDIAARNLHRAADLVQNFKQVAVDQTSSQRRDFELHEVVHEMVVSLRPSFHRTPYRIEVGVPSEGLRMDSYAGALGQTIGNLIQNAVVHGFDGRAHGTVRITAGRDDRGWIVLRVSDDGHGIPASLMERIFEPFVTTKMGQGGTGLGLHISYNAVVNLLGGTLGVRSTEGEGSCFELHLPPEAPRPVDTPPADGSP